MIRGRCKTLTVLPANELDGWIEKYSSSSFVGKYSRGISNERTLASAFKIDFRGTPTEFMIERNGSVVADDSQDDFQNAIGANCL